MVNLFAGVRCAWNDFVAAHNSQSTSDSWRNIWELHAAPYECCCCYLMILIDVSVYLMLLLADASCFLLVLLPIVTDYIFTEVASVFC